MAQKRQGTLERYERIQYFYAVIKGYGCFSHRFAEKLIAIFFNIEGDNTINRILNEDIPDNISYQFKKLDEMWIKAFIKNKFNKIIDEEIESESNE